MSQIFIFKRNSKIPCKILCLPRLPARWLVIFASLLFAIFSVQGEVSAQVPVITSPASGNAKVGMDFIYQISATNSPTRYAATGLPHGLVLNAKNGRIGGVPLGIDGIYNATVSAGNAAGTASQTLRITVAPSLPVMTTAASAEAKQGVPFSLKITASNHPRTFGAIGLPAGLTLNATTGVISGIPAASGNANITLTATNGAGTSTRALALTIHPPLPVITSAATANAKVETAFLYQITATNNPTRYAATGLPSGLSVHLTMGKISGSPSAIDGIYNATISAINGSGTASQALRITVAPTLPVITSASSAQAKQGTAFSYKITANNYPRSFGATGLPSGLTLNATSGVIGGTPLSAGNATVTITATNGAGTATRSLFIVINPPAPVITGEASVSAKVGTAFSYQITASNSPRSYGASGLPGGLTVNSTSGLIAGVPTAIDGIYNATLSAANAGGVGIGALRITVAPTLPVITSASSAQGRQGMAFNYAITAGNFPRSFAATGLPSGLTLNTASGVISGTPVSAGNATITLMAKNGAGNATKSLALTINPPPPVVTSAASANATVGLPFTHQIMASNNPTSYNATGLPSGLSVNSTSGLISGVPVSATNATVTLVATNGSGSGTKTLLLKIGWMPLSINSSEIPAGILRQPYAGHSFSAVGGAGGNTWSLADGYLPSGMTLNPATGALAGTPTDAGTFTFMLHVQDSSGLQDEVEVVLEVQNPLGEFTTGSILSVIPGGGAPQYPGNTTCSFDYDATGSFWNAGVSEEKVFFASMNSSSGWRLGIGKGGQVYSLRGSFGEAIPPQRADAPWVDEAWQFVATNVDLVGPIQKFQSLGSEQRRLGFPITFFIHQSGIYMGSLAGNTVVGSPSAPFYSPILKKNWNPATRTLSVVSWSQMARSPNVWKSGMLTYASYRDLGDGTIEATNFVTNFGEQDITFINTPWGGTRHSSFPQIILSQPEGGWSIGSTASYGIPAPIRLSQTGGWQAWTRNSTQNSADTVAVVFGTDPLTGALPGWRTGRSVLTYGVGGDAVRDYDVSSVHNNIKLQAGQSIACRWHLVLGSFGQVRSKAAALSAYAGLWMPETDATILTPVWTTAGVPSSTGTGEPNYYLYAQPIPGTVPVFAMEDTRTGRIFATLDPYELCPTAPYPNPLPTTHAQYALYQNRVVHYQYASPGLVRDLLGYAYPAATPAGSHVQISLPGVGTVPLNLWVPAL